MDFLHGITVVQWMMAAFVAMTVMFIWWIKSNQPAWFDFLCCFPIVMFGHIGMIKQLKGNTDQVSSKKSWVNGLSGPEHALCVAYQGKVTYAASEVFFTRAKDYLRFTHQTNVTPMSIFAFGLVVLLTVAEAMGTGFLISPFVASEMSSSEMSYVGWGLAFVFAFGLLWVTHMAGGQTRKKISIKHALGDMDQNGKPQDMVSDDPISHTMDQSVDNGKSSEARYYRRAINGRDRGSWLPLVGAALFLVVILGVLFFVRYDGIKKQNTINVEQIKKNGIGDAGASAGNPFADAGSLPPEVVSNQQESRKKMAEEIGNADLAQGFGAAIFLSLVYLLTQIVGFGFAFKHAFVSEGMDAYNKTRGQPDYQSYYAKYVFPYESRAEARLADLRQHFCNGLPEYRNNPATKTFHQFNLEKQTGSGGVQNQSEPVATAVPLVAEQVSQFGADASAIADLPIDQQAAAIEIWLSDNGRKHKTGFMAEIDRLNASKAASSNSGDAAMYAAAAKSIMSLPEAEREPAMIAWLTDNGAKHEDGMMEAIAHFIENQVATPKINSKLSAMLKGQNA